MVFALKRGGWRQHIDRPRWRRAVMHARQAGIRAPAADKRAHGLILTFQQFSFSAGIGRFWRRRRRPARPGKILLFGSGCFCVGGNLLFYK